MVLWMIRLICSVPITTPVIPPRNPNTNSEMNIPENTGLSQGALRSHSNIPLVRPLFRWATSIDPGTVSP